mmetsp:Transcript_132939/g.413330  ORF Transcript_132939/g.413330 Transcript_132939/m.413330 type:complete len:375 (-) Transcript_132939:54-1178(-)
MSLVSWRIFTSAPVALQMPMMTSPPRPMSRATNCWGTMTSRLGAPGRPPGTPGAVTRSDSQSGTDGPPGTAGGGGGSATPAGGASPPASPASGREGSGEAAALRSFRRARLPLRLRLAAASGLRRSSSLAFFRSSSLAFFRSLSFPLFFFFAGVAERLSSRSFRRVFEREWLASRRSFSLSFLSFFFSFFSLGGTMSPPLSMSGLNIASVSPSRPSSSICTSSLLLGFLAFSPFIMGLSLSSLPGFGCLGFESVRSPRFLPSTMSLVLSMMWMACSSISKRLSSSFFLSTSCDSCRLRSFSALSLAICCMRTSMSTRVLAKPASSSLALSVMSSQYSLCMPTRFISSWRFCGAPLAAASLRRSGSESSPQRAWT